MIATVDDPAAATAELAAALTIAEHLIHQPDVITGTSSLGGAYTSRPPWNPDVAAVLFTVVAAVVVMDAELTEHVTGRPARRRGHTTREVTAALDHIAKTANQASRPEYARVMHRLPGLVARIFRLPAIGLAMSWRPIPTKPRCPYCDSPHLRAAVDLPFIMCQQVGCQDLDGNRPPQGLMLWDRDGLPVIVWRDGTKTPALTP